MNIQLVRIKQSELKSAWLMQKIGFMDIFFKYFEIWIGEKEGIGYLANLFVLKKYRNQGIAQRAVVLAESLYPHYNIWRLDTIKQESRNCHVYEKLGYVPTGAEKKINKRMIIIDYEKRLD